MCSSDLKCNELRSSNSTRNRKDKRNKQKHRSNRRTIRSIKKRRNNKTNNSRGGQRKCKNSRGKTNKRNRGKGQELELQEKRMILDAIQGGVDSLLKIEQTNKEITDLEKILKTQNVEIGANEMVRTTAIAQKAMDYLTQQNRRVAGVETKEPILATGKNVVVIGGGERVS